MGLLLVCSSVPAAQTIGSISVLLVVEFFWRLFVHFWLKVNSEISHYVPLRGLWQFFLLLLENSASKAIVSEFGLVVILSLC